MNETEKTIYSVAVYLIDRAYGGPEEGGWYYDTGVLAELATVREHIVLWRPMYFNNEDEAIRWCQRVNHRIDQSDMNKGRRDIYSVLSTGRYRAVVREDAPASFPAEVPTYS